MVRGELLEDVDEEGDVVTITRSGTSEISSIALNASYNLAMSRLSSLRCSAQYWSSRCRRRSSTPSVYPGIEVFRISHWASASYDADVASPEMSNFSPSSGVSTSLISAII